MNTMKTLYRLDVNELDMEGRSRTWRIGTEYDTLTAIEAKAMKYQGIQDEYRIVARTIDEASFSVVDETVKSWSWYEAVGKYEDAEDDIEYYTEELNKAEAKKARCKSETSAAKLDEEIKRYKERLDKAVRVLASRK